MKYDFDEIVERHHTDCAKYDLIAKLGKPADTIPLWVADMDFKVPPEVSAQLMEMVRLGVYGYAAEGDDSYFQALSDWFEVNHGFLPEPQWVIKAPGVVFSLASAIRALTGPGDSLIIQEPVYHPFARMININERIVVNSSLIYDGGRYRMDLVDFEKKIIDHKVKVFVLCSPHNPVGRVWSREELLAVGEICLKHDCLVVSDEIHCDFVRPGHRHCSWLTLPPEHVQNVVVCTAPSKTFNLAGLQASNMFIPNSHLREKVKLAINQAGYDGLSVPGLVACRAAYRLGRDWLDQLKDYLEGNLAAIKQAATALPGLKVVEPEGTYLVWLDFKDLGLTLEELDELLTVKARLWLDEGQKFGPAGRGFYRLNMACPRATLKKALGRLKDVWPRG